MSSLGSSQNLDALRQQSHAAIRALSQTDKDKWDEQFGRFGARAERNRIESLILEFQAPFDESCQSLMYEHAFVYEWVSSAPRLYEARWPICGHTAGVYFIYDEQESLRYIGSAYCGDLGYRIWHTKRKPYRSILDVVLFGEHWCHFALAFEALAVSRIKPPENTSFKSLWIEPPPPFDRIWPRQV